LESYLGRYHHRPKAEEEDNMRRYYSGLEESTLNAAI
jgi:hypothetical protein